MYKQVTLPKRRLHLRGSSDTCTDFFIFSFFNYSNNIILHISFKTNNFLDICCSALCCACFFMPGFAFLIYNIDNYEQCPQLDMTIFVHNRCRLTLLVGLRLKNTLIS